MKLSKTVQKAIKSGYVPKLRDWRNIPISEMTTGEKVCYFIENTIAVPEGELVGKNMKLLEFQEVFIQSIFDGEVRARKAILSVGRKAGKTTVISCLMLAFMFMKDLLKHNSRINSAALSRDQAGLVFTYMSKSLQLSSKLQGLYRIIPSGKRIVALKTGIEYQALAAEAGKAMGLSPAVIVGDEWGQVVGASNPFIDALLTSQGAHKDPLAIIISTQAPSDSDFLSIAIDDAIRSPSKEVVCHLYTSDKDLAIDDEAGWVDACPAIGSFRSFEDVKMQAQQALRLPTAQASFENLILNRRVSMNGLWLAPEIWKANSAQPDMEVFRNYPVSCGIDLSTKHDLTAAVLSAKDGDGFIHILPFTFIPDMGLAEKSVKDRAPYDAWVREGKMIAVNGSTIDYEWVIQFLKVTLEDLEINLSTIEFDRWRISIFKAEADRHGFGQDCVWHEVGQGYQSMSPRCEFFQQMLLQNKIRHGSQALLNMAAANAIIDMDPAGNMKLAKNRSTQKIDTLVAAVMSVGAFMDQQQEFDVNCLIG